MIINLNNLSEKIEQIRKTYKTIVLVGGCFDILHIGHIKFLSQAKKKGDYLIILLESDPRVKKLKGANRPIFNQQERAVVLDALKDVDLVITLSESMNDSDYKSLVTTIKPSVIAITQGDPNQNKKESHSDSLTKIEIIPHVNTYSSSNLAHLLGVE